MSFKEEYYEESPLTCNQSVLNLLRLVFISEGVGVGVVRTLLAQ